MSPGRELIPHRPHTRAILAARGQRKGPIVNTVLLAERVSSVKLARAVGVDRLQPPPLRRDRWPVREPEDLVVDHVCRTRGSLLSESLREIEFCLFGQCWLFAEKIEGLLRVDDFGFGAEVVGR